MKATYKIYRIINCVNLHIIDITEEERRGLKVYLKKLRNSQT